MLAPRYVGSGPGVTVTGASGIVEKTGCKAGNFIIVQSHVNGAESATTSEETNLEDILGVDGAVTTPPGAHYQVGSTVTGRQCIFYGRAMADGTCSVQIEIVTNDLVAIMHEIEGVTSDAAILKVLDNASNVNKVTQSVGNSTTPTANNSAVTSTGDNRLALAFVAITADVDVADMTGETGGYDWVEAAEYSDTPGTVQLQVATMPTAGVVRAGSQTISTSAGWAVDATGLVPAVASDRPDFGRFPKEKLRAA